MIIHKTLLIHMIISSMLSLRVIILTIVAAAAKTSIHGTLLIAKVVRISLSMTLRVSARILGVLRRTVAPGVAYLTIGKHLGRGTRHMTALMVPAPRMSSIHSHHRLLRLPALLFLRRVLSRRV